MLVHVLVSMACSVALVLLFGIMLVFKPSPWHDIRLTLPVVALFLSTAISSISIGLSTALTQLTTGGVSVWALSPYPAPQNRFQCALPASGGSRIRT